MASAEVRARRRGEGGGRWEVEAKDQRMAEPRRTSAALPSSKQAERRAAMASMREEGGRRSSSERERGNGGRTVLLREGENKKNTDVWGHALVVGIEYDV